MMADRKEEAARLGRPGNDDGRQAQRDGVEEASAGGVCQNQLGGGLLRAVAVAGDLAGVVGQHGVLGAAEAGDRVGEHHARRFSPRSDEAAAGVHHRIGAAQVDSAAEVIVGLGLSADHRGEVEDNAGAGRDGFRRQVHDVAGERGDWEGGGGLGRFGEVEQGQAGDRLAAEGALGGKARGELAAEEAAAAQDGDQHGADPPDVGRQGATAASRAQAGGGCRLCG
jgi:hypothetical protein